MSLLHSPEGGRAVPHVSPPSWPTILLHFRFTVVLAPSKRCCGCTMTYLRERGCLRDVSIHRALAVDKLTSPYGRHRAMDVPKWLTVPCNPTGAKSITDLRPRKAYGFAKYLAEGGEGLLLAGQRRNDTSGMPILPRHFLEADLTVLCPTKAHV